MLLNRGAFGLREGARQRFPSITPVRPQPSTEHATYLVTPAWSTDIYVLLDLTRINGTMYSAYVAPALARESILVIAELDRSAQVAVYGPDSLGPLRPGEVVQLQLGDCLTFAPTDHDWFVVATLGDMLQGHEGWRDLAALPVAPGCWLHILTDAEPCRFLLHDATGDSSSERTLRPPLGRHWLRSRSALRLRVFLTTWTVAYLHAPLLLPPTSWTDVVHIQTHVSLTCLTCGRSAAV